ncbi:hypothetical protein RJ55_04114 [Drechmeria coniospora]|nr:hypothetical protein RJ55_04114 [Drechmeria coniospora]
MPQSAPCDPSTHTAAEAAFLHRGRYTTRHTTRHTTRYTTRYTISTTQPATTQTASRRSRPTTCHRSLLPYSPHLLLLHHLPSSCRERRERAERHALVMEKQSLMLSPSSSSSPSPSPSPSPSLTIAPPLPPRFLVPRRPLIHRTPILILFAVAAAAALVFPFRSLLALAPCTVTAGCYGGYRSAYSFDAHAAHNAAWMARLPDAVPISSLSIPGSHDSMTYGPLLRRDPVLHCQNWNLSVQLEAGLRYFDIRARLRDGELRIYHADGDTGFALGDDVLRPIIAFLDEHPSEAIVMRLKEEGPPISGGRRSGDASSFEAAFLRVRDAIPSAAARISTPSGALPTLGALRSRILLLQNFASEHAADAYGPAWDGPQMALEDVWIIPDVYHLADKWTAVRAALERAATDPLDNRLLYLAHVSASVGVLPVEAAAGPANRTVTGMNDMTGQWLRDFEAEPAGRRTGIVIFDFPGKRVIEAVLAWNKKLLAQ